VEEGRRASHFAYAGACEERHAVTSPGQPHFRGWMWIISMMPCNHSVRESALSHIIPSQSSKENIQLLALLFEAIFQHRVVKCRKDFFNIAVEKQNIKMTSLILLIIKNFNQATLFWYGLVASAM